MADAGNPKSWVLAGNAESYSSYFFIKWRKER
jgi:hypothetical protein